MKLITILLLALLFNTTLFAQTIVQRGGRLQVNGNHVTTEYGQEVSLAGNSMFWSNGKESAGFYQAEAVNHLSDDWNSKVMRVALGVKEDWPDVVNNYIDFPEIQKAKIRRVIDAAIDKGMYIIIDWHTHKAEQYTNEAAQFFSEMAEIYGEYDNIIYEIYNEPLNTTSWDTVKNYARPVIAAIRAKDPDNLIIVGTRTWCQEVEEAADRPITGDPNLAYSLHYYANTHGQWLIDRARRAMDKGIALFVTEYGTTDASGNGGFNPGESQKWYEFLIDNKISYVNWNISDKAEDSSIVSAETGIQGLLSNNLTASGEFVRNNMLSRNYDDINAPLSTDDVVLDNDAIEIFPNPTQNELFIKSSSLIDAISIFDITGKLVFSKQPKTNSKEVEINIKSLSQGSYILKLESSGKITARKILKQ